MAEHTPGPWTVETQEHQHYLGGTHKERWIYTAWEHPQLKGQCPIVTNSIGIGETKGSACRQMVSIKEADARLIAAAPDGLEVAQAIEHALSMGFTGGSVLAESSPIRAALRAFVAKATGEAVPSPAEKGSTSA